MNLIPLRVPYEMGGAFKLELEILSKQGGTKAPPLVTDTCEGPNSRTLAS